MKARRSGFALLAVLWVIVALGLVGAEIHELHTAELRMAANAQAGARTRWIARGTHARMVSTLDRLLAADSGGRVLAAAGDTVLPPLRLRLDGVLVQASVVDARARVNSDSASAEELERLALAIGMSGADAAHWARGRAAGPPDRPGAPAAPSDLQRRLEALLTTAGDGRINVNAAPAAVLAVLPGVGEAGAEALVRRRRLRPFSNVYEVITTLLPAAGSSAVTPDSLGERIAFRAREVEIRTTARVEGSPASFHIVAVAVLEPQGVSLRGVMER